MYATKTWLEELLEPLSDDRLRQAAGFNNRYAKRFGWADHQAAIRKLLGLNWVHNDLAFAAAVARWQEKQGFRGRQIDGKLGSGTWKKMKRQLGLTSGSAPASAAGRNLEDDLKKAIRFFGGTVVDPRRFSADEAGFAAYLRASGVQFFGADEMLRPNQPAMARRLGYRILLPKQEWWPRGIALAKLADQLRLRTGQSIRLRNWWRPAEYNARVGGAKSSDHIAALGVDLDYPTINQRRIAESFLKELQDRHIWLRMSLGLGYRTTHVGILSRRGKRTWRYKGYRP